MHGGQSAWRIYLLRRRRSRVVLLLHVVRKTRENIERKYFSTFYCNPVFLNVLIESRISLLRYMKRM